MDEFNDLPTGGINPNSVSFYSNDAGRWYQIDPRTIPITSLWAGTATAGQIITIHDNGYNVIGIDDKWITLEQGDLRYIKIVDGAKGVSFDNEGTNFESEDVQDALVELDVKIEEEGSAFFVGDTPPAEPIQGLPWYNSEDGRTYVWYMDGTSDQWVDSSPAIVGEGVASLVSYTNVNTKLAAGDVQVAIDKSYFISKGSLALWSSATDVELVVMGEIATLTYISTGIYQVEFPEPVFGFDYSVSLQTGSRDTLVLSQLNATYYDKTGAGFKIALLDNTTLADGFAGFELNIKVML
jgi:hypothetical protein